MVMTLEMKFRVDSSRESPVSRNEAASRRSTRVRTGGTEDESSGGNGASKIQEWHGFDR